MGSAKRAPAHQRGDATGRAAGNSLIADPSIHPDAFDWKSAFAPEFEKGGFDVVIGNPPWEMIRRDCASGRTGPTRDPIVKFVRESGLFPLCQHGHLNLYQPFMYNSEGFQP